MAGVTYTKKVYPPHPFDMMDGGQTGGTDRTLQLGKLKLQLHTHPTFGMGRFGGGWQWKIGLQASQGFRTTTIDLITCSLCVTWR